MRQPLVRRRRPPAARTGRRSRRRPAAPGGGAPRPASRSDQPGRPLGLGARTRPRRSAAARPAAAARRCRSRCRRGARRPTSWRGPASRRSCAAPASGRCAERRRRTGGRRCARSRPAARRACSAGRSSSANAATGDAPRRVPATAGGGQVVEQQRLGQRAAATGCAGRGRPSRSVGCARPASTSTCRSVISLVRDRRRPSAAPAPDGPSDAQSGLGHPRAQRLARRRARAAGRRPGRSGRRRARSARAGRRRGPGVVLEMRPASGASMTSVLSLRVGDPQRDPQVGVGADLRRHDAAGPLGGEDQVDAERPAALGDVDQAGDEVGQLADHRGELVDDDDQPRHRRQRRVAAEQVDVVLDVLGARRGQQVLAAAQLGAERLQRALDQVGVEVGDHADGVRQPHAVLERGAALVVDEHEGQRVRAVGDRQRGDQRLQQLGLAGAGGAGDQAVRAVAAQVEARTARRWTRRSAPRCCGRPCAQRAAMASAVGRLEAEHVEQPARDGQGRVLGVAADVAQRRQRPRHPLAPGRRHEVGPHVARRRRCASAGPARRSPPRRRPPGTPPAAAARRRRGRRRRRRPPGPRAAPAPCRAATAAGARRRGPPGRRARR